ncbi:MAG: ABC transporter permease subunit [Acidimicrobiaceae bacterium]|nr:ABC transporter permease subunit [Acidimicrobiaceae bacterium]
MTDASTGLQAITASHLQISPLRRLREMVVRHTLLVAVLVSVMVSALILWSLLSEAWDFIVHVVWSDTWGQLGWFPRRGIYDIPTILIPTFIVTLIAMIVAGPLGLGAAIYLSEYAGSRVRSWIKPILEILAGIPSVVLGFFALTWIAPNLVARIGKNVFLIIGLAILAAYVVVAARIATTQLKKLKSRATDREFTVDTGMENTTWITLTASLVVLTAVLAMGVVWFIDVWVDFIPASAGSLAAAGIGVGILTIPLVASVSEDAMAAVPNSLREASAGLGAEKMTTATNVIVPAALSGIVAAFIVATSRAIGETMVVFLAGGAADASEFTISPFDGGLTMTAAMASLASGTDNVVGEGLTFQSLYFVGLVLFLITLGLNLVAARFVARLREAY